MKCGVCGTAKLFHGREIAEEVSAAVVFAEEEGSVLAGDEAFAAVAVPGSFGAREDASEVAEVAGFGVEGEEMRAVLPDLSVLRGM